MDRSILKNADASREDVAALLEALAAARPLDASDYLRNAASIAEFARLRAGARAPGDSGLA